MSRIGSRIPSLLVGLLVMPAVACTSGALDNRIGSNRSPADIVFGHDGHIMPVSSDGLQSHAAPIAAGALTYYGGPVIPNVNILTVFWDSTVQNQAGINQFFTDVTNSPYLDWLSEYNTNITAANGQPGTNQQIGRGTLGGSVVDPAPPAGTSITDAQIEQEISRLISAGSLPPPDANSLYMVYFRPGDVITMPGGGQSCSVFCAYHSTFQLNGTDVYYGVMPDLGGACAGGCGTGALLDNETMVSSHEMGEAITDAAVGLTLDANGNITNFAPPLAWFDQNGGEVGDLCNQQTATVAGHVVQTLWSNATNACIATSGGGTCPAGETQCGTSCVNLNNDSNNCGACGNVCPAGQTCQAGVCSAATCPTGLTLCGTACVDLTSDPNNCGACGNACASGETCQNSVCTATNTCPTGQTLCGTTCVDLTSDPNNCGACGNVCPSGDTCQSSTCTVTNVCPAGQTLCGSVCVDLTSDPNNCGFCGNVCPSGDTCQSSTCTATNVCPAGQTLCGSICIDLNSDPTNCGFCGDVCPSGDTCQSGVCTAPVTTRSAAIVSPANGSVFNSGDSFQIVAQATSPAPVLSVWLHWTTQTGSTAIYPMTSDGMGNWVIGGTFGAVGSRIAYVTAKDSTGMITKSSKITIYVQ